MIPAARYDDPSIVSGRWYRLPGWRAAARKKRLLRPTPLILLFPLLASCAAIPDIVGAAAGGAAGGATANPAVGFAVGIGVRASVDELRRYVDRTRARGEQDAIAQAAGAAPLNESRPWEIRHTIPLGNDHGTLTVTREIATPLATCREILFTTKDQAHFTTTLCRQQTAWKWAAAEPAVQRWGYLQ